MAKTLTIDPVTRIEGHLRIDTEVENGKVTAAWSKGEMFRGFEALLKGRDPLDAAVITQRICGVCPVSHGIAASRAVEDAMGLKVPDNGLYLRNLILGANYLQSHILHFYHLSALDFVNLQGLLDYSGNDPVLKEMANWVHSEVKTNRVLPAAPFLPSLPGGYVADRKWNLGAVEHYLQALEMRQETHRMAALFGGKMPHTATLAAGGVTCGVDPAVTEDFRMRLQRVRRFVEDVYLPDVLTAARLFPAYADIGAGVGRFLSYGVFDETGDSTWLAGGTVDKNGFSNLDTNLIGEEATCSFYAEDGQSLEPQPHKQGAYSWLKAPRYAGQAYEVGPLARLVVAAEAGSREVNDGLSDLLKVSGLRKAQLNSVLGRHAARVLEACLLARRMESWLDRLQPGQPSVAPYQPRPSGQGMGLTEAPRGALGHWVEVKDLKIASYSCIVPSTWNFSPRDGSQNPGAVEAALIGTPINDDFKGVEVARVVRSFDPCIACAVH